MNEVNRKVSNFNSVILKYQFHLYKSTENQNCLLRHESMPKTLFSALGGSFYVSEIVKWQTIFYYVGTNLNISCCEFPINEKGK